MTFADHMRSLLARARRDNDRQRRRAARLVVATIAAVQPLAPPAAARPSRR